MKKDVLLPNESLKRVKLVSDIQISEGKGSFIGGVDEDVFSFVDNRFTKEEYFFSSDVSYVQSCIAGVYKQKKGIICSPKDVFNEIAYIVGGLNEIAFPNEKYIKKIISDNFFKIYPYGFGTFFLYEANNGNKIISQVMLEEGGISIDAYKYEEFNAPLSFLHKSLFVVFSHFV